MYYVVLNARCSTVSSTSARNLWRTRFSLGYKVFLLPELLPHSELSFLISYRNHCNPGVSSLVSMATKVCVNYELNHKDIILSKGKKGKVNFVLVHFKKTLRGANYYYYYYHHRHHHFITFMQGVYSYIPETNHISRV